MQAPAKRKRLSDGGAASALQSLLETYMCPITYHLMVNPVVMTDGATYEKSAIERWLLTNESSPKTGQALSSKVCTACTTTRQAITALVECGAVSEKEEAQWHMDSGKMKHVGELPGGSAAARTHFAAAKCLAEAGSKTATEAAVILKALDLKAEAEKQGVDISFVMGSLQRPDACWKLLTTWQELTIGAKVRVLGNVAALKRLCLRAPHDFAEGDEVGWDESMASFAGQDARVVSCDAEAGSYELAPHLISNPEPEDAWSFPFDCVRAHVAVGSA